MNPMDDPLHSIFKDLSALSHKVNQPKAKQVNPIKETVLWKLYTSIAV